VNEVIRFRIARAPQRAVLEDERTLQLSDSETMDAWAGSDDVPSLAAAWLGALGIAPPARRFAHPDPDVSAALGQVRWLDELLAARDNAVAWKDVADEVEKRLDGTASAVAERWDDLREQLSLTLVAAIAAPADPALGQDVLRLLLVIGLVELVAVRGDLHRHAVADALRTRIVTLPPWLLEAFGLGRSRLARRPSVSDLFLVREEWSRFEVGEIAHIENVLKGETKKRQVERTEETEVTTTTEQESDRLEERDNQTTDRFELRQEAQRDTDLALHVDGKLDVSAQYGTAKIDAHVGASFDYAVEESSKRAVTQARESVARAVTRVEERVREQRLVRSLTRFHTTDRHGLVNDEGDDHVVGIYRWVDKIKTVQVFRYPHRLLFEFEVPEPGAFIRWLHGRPRQGARPIPFLTVDGSKDGVPLVADHITSGPTDLGASRINYEELAGRYAVQGLEPPPGERMVFASIPYPPATAGGSQASNPPPVYSTNSVTIADGWEGYRFSVYAVATNAVPEGPGLPTGWLELVIGTDFPSQAADDADPQLIWRFQGTNVFRELKSMSFREPVTGQVPVQLATDDVSGLLATVQIFCRPTTSTVQTWRQATFDLIQGAYFELRRDEERAGAEASVRDGIAISGSSPTRNQEVIQEELRRSVVELLRGSAFDGLPATVYDDDDVDPPRIDLDANDRTAAEIQFIEQAFEWENLSYMLYAYFWADSEIWPDLQAIEGPDADFDRFLRAGSARVVVPARPGFELQTHLYTLFGTLWGGGPVPMPGDALYLSIAEEVRAMQRPPADGEPGEWWEVRLPTTLVYLSPLGTTIPLKHDAAELPVNP
jgi:hypothetical protein